MIRHLALASVLAIGSSVFLAPTAKAQTVTEQVPFTGTVPVVCEFENTTPGVMTPDTNPATQLSSFNTGGVSGYTYLTCNSGSEVRVAPTGVVQTDGPLLNPSVSTAYVNGGTGPIVYPTPVQNQEIEVDLTVDQGGALLPAGDYGFEVTVTAVAS